MAAIVIVGAGECGARAALTLREAGHEGPVILLGEEPHLPYERPPLSKTIPVEPVFTATEAAFAAAGVELRRGARVAEIDRAARCVRLADGGSVDYDRLLLATGARARILPGLEAAATLRTLDDARAILGRIGPGVRLAVIGGGFIGLELAATARGAGATVTVLEAADRPMARGVPAEIAAVIAARHAAEGVEIVTGARIAAVRADGVDLADGRSLAADLVVAGVGAVPNTGLAAAAGLSVENGIVVDERLATGDPAVFAAGDCCAFPWRGRRIRLESWRNAQDQGVHVARAMLGDPAPYARVPWFWSDQYDLGLQIAGLPDPAAPSIRRERPGEGLFLFQLDGDGRLASAAGVGGGATAGREIRIAEMLIERGARPDPAALADPGVNLKSLLKRA